MTSEKSLKRQIIEFTVPLIFMYIINQAYGFTDNIIIAACINESALAVLSACMGVINVGFALTSGIGSAAGLLVSRTIGAKEYSPLTQIVKDSLKVGLLLSAVVAAVYFIFGRRLLILINTPASILDQSAGLVYIYTVSIILGILCAVLHSTLNGMGDSRKPTLYIVLSQFLNIILDIITVKYLNWGVVGAAWASIFSQAVSIVFLAALLIHRFQDYGALSDKHPLKAFCADTAAESYIKRVIKLGIPCLLQRSVMSAGALIINSYVNTFGVSYMSGYSAVNTIADLLIVPMLGITTALEVYASMSIGAKDKRQLRTVTHFLFPTGLVFCGIVVTITLIFSRTFIGLFLDDPSGQSFAFADSYLRIYSFSYVFIFIKYFFDSLFKAYQKIYLFVITSFTALGVRIFLTYILSGSMQADSITAAVLISNAAAMLIAVTIYICRIRPMTENDKLRHKA